jgi:hypothetical protein
MFRERAAVAIDAIGRRKIDANRVSAIVAADIPARIISGSGPIATGKKAMTTSTN